MCTQESHARAKSDSVWPTLKFIGFLPDEDDDGRPAPLALANCALCGSTLARRATAQDLAEQKGEGFHQARQASAEQQVTSVTFHLAAAYKRLPTPDHRYLLQTAIAKSNRDLLRRFQ